jgi:hypothetical protein
MTVNGTLDPEAVIGRELLDGFAEFDESFTYALSRDRSSRVSSITCFSRSITALEHMDVTLQSRECLWSHEELLSGRPLDVASERIGAEHPDE